MADILDAIAHPNVVNPLAAFGAAADLTGKLNQNALFRAQQAAGRAYQQATDPATGVVDPAKAASLIAADPAAAMAAQGNATSGQALTGAQQEQALQRSGYISQALAPVLKLDDAGLKQGVHDALLRAVADRVLTPQQATAAALNLSNDPATMRTQLQQIQIRGQSPELAQRSVYGNPTMVDTGGQIVPGVQSPQTGGFAAAPGGMGKSLSPGEATAPTQIGTTADGRPIMGTRTQFVGAAGDAVPGAPASPLGTGRVPAALRNPAAAGNGQPAAGGAAAPSAATAVSPSAAPGVTTGLSPAQSAAASETGGASAKAFADITNQGQEAQSQSALLGNMLADTTQFTSGPLADRILRIKQMAQRFGLPGDVEGTSAQESFNKMAKQLVKSAGSDARLAVQEDANPHAELSPGGLDLIIRKLQGNADWQQARARLAAGYADKADRAGFESKVGAVLDPRAFQFQRMTVPQRQSYVKSLSPADLRQVRASYNAVFGQGGLIGPGGSDAAAAPAAAADVPH